MVTLCREGRADEFDVQVKTVFSRQRERERERERERPRER